MRDRELFLSALEIEDPAVRQAHLKDECGDDAALLARVEALLSSHESQSQFLQTPVVEQMTDAADAGLAATMLIGNGSTQDDELDVTAVHAHGPVTMTDPHDDAEDEVPLGYLEPSSKPDSLGRLGHYEVLEVVGRGAFGTVLRAFDEKLHRVVAIKVLAPEMATTSPARKRFIREAQASAAIRHEHVVSIYAVEEKPIPYLVMEYIPGLTLQQRLDERGPLEIPGVLRLGRQIAEGLAAAHAQHLIHRDIKPGNILLETGVHDRVKITDFGLARAADDASLTQSGLIAGTPMYMAPEQALGHKLDPRADLFSYGSVLYQMVSGRPPFRAASTLAVLKRVTEETPRPISEIIPETPQWLCDIITKLHAKNPDDRYQSAQEVADVLANCEAQLKSSPTLQDFSRIPRVTSPSGSDQWKWIAAATLLLPVLALALTETAGVTQLFRGRAPGSEAVIRVIPATSDSIGNNEQPPSKARHPELANHHFASDEWIDVIPLIDPHADKCDMRLTGKNDWRIEGGELIVGADNKPSKLLLPLDAAWQAFECEVEFTRRSGPGGINVNIPAPVGDCPVVFGPPNTPGVYLGRKGGGVSLNKETALQVGQRSTLRLEVRRQQNQDHVSVWVNGAAAGTWQGDRSRIATVANEGYPHARRMSLWTHQGGNEMVFHRIRVRMLDGGTADTLRPVPNPPSGKSPALAIAPFDTVQAKKHQEDWAAYLNVPVEYTNSIGMKFRLIPPGEFLMGASDEEIERALVNVTQSWQVDRTKAEGPQRPMTIREPYYLGQFEVTLGQFRQFVQETGYKTTAETNGKGGERHSPSGEIEASPDYLWSNPFDSETDDHPVVFVSIEDARRFCSWLTKKDGRRYTVPRDDQWEFACRAGTTTWWFDEKDVQRIAWTRENSESRLHPIGQMAANPFGLCDMHGNVGELCEAVAPKKVARRGGQTTSIAISCRSASRWEVRNALPWFRQGFRVAIVGDLKGDVLAPATLADADIQRIAALPQTFTSSIGMEFMIVPKGKSWLGGGEERPGDKEVEIPADFYLGKYEVTQEEWENVMGEKPSRFSRNGKGMDAVKDINDEDLKRFPVENVSWDQCQIFIKKLNELEHGTSWCYRLPMEVEWEYACRGGPQRDRAASAFDFYLAQPTNTLSKQQANIGGNSGLNRPCKVGAYEPNPLGLHDLHGNVYEWCLDAVARTEGQPWRATRSGCFRHGTDRCLAVHSHSSPPPAFYDDLGFRLARVPTDAPSPETKVPPPAVAPFDAAQARTHREPGGAVRTLDDQWLKPLQRIPTVDPAPCP